MPTILASAIIDDAETILQDTTNVRWAAAELLRWLNEGQRVAAIIKPEIHTETDQVQLAVGVRQTIPATAHRLIGVHCNTNSDGSTPGAAVTLTSRDHLDAQRPLWRADSRTDEIEGYMYDPRTPREYLVYPPNDGTGYVEMSYAVTPADIALGAAILIDDIYAGALLDYVLYRAYSKDAEAASNAALAAAHIAAFRAVFTPSEAA